MRAIRLFFQDCDMFSAPATLRIRSNPQMKSFTMGLLSFLVACYFTYVFINNCIQMINYQNISYSESSTTLRSNETNGKFQTFAVTFDYIDLEQFNTMFAFQAGAYVNGQYSKSIQLRQCVEDDWVLLGDTYKTDYVDYYLDWMLCPSVVQEYRLNDTFRSITPDFVVLSLTLCDSTDPNCDHSKAEQYLQNQTAMYGSATIWVYLLDKTIIPDKFNSVQYFINIDTKTEVSTSFGGAATVEFANFQVQTDVNVFPWEGKETVTGCQVDTVRNYQIGFTNLTTDIIGKVLFTMNQKKHVVTRKVGKVDELLSYAGGLFSIIIGFLAFFLQSYSQYKYELFVAESSFNYDESGNKVREGEFLFWNYVMYTIFDWVNLLCCCSLSNCKTCTKVDETRETVIKQMEVDRLLLRLNKIQGSLKLMMDLDEKMVMNLVAHPALHQVQADLHAIDYFNEVMNGKSSETLSQFTLDQNYNQVVKVGCEKTNQTFSMIEVIEVRNVYSLSSLTDGKQYSNSQSRINFRDRLNLLPLIAGKFPDLKEQADSIKLSEQFDMAQHRLTLSFFKINPQKRRELQQKIPVVILFRLKEKAVQIEEIQKDAQF